MMYTPVDMNETAAEPVTAPYGTWKSPITAELISSESITFGGLAVGPSGAIYAVESRPDGRNTIVAWAKDLQDSPVELLSAPDSALTKVHGYGGGAIAVDPASGHIIFSNQGQGVSALDPTTREITPIIEPQEGVHFADFDVRNDGRWILAIKEDHTGAKSAADVENSLVVIDRTTGKHRSVCSGADFYAHPRFSPSGNRVSWINWHHPDMPWTGNTLSVWTFDAKSGCFTGESLFEDGRNGQISIAQPRWGLDEVLFYTSDKTGTWQFEYVDLSKTNPFGKLRLSSHKIKLEGYEHGDFAEPEWFIGSSTYAHIDSETIVATWTHSAQEQLVRIDLRRNKCETIKWALTGIRGNALKRLNDKEFIVIGSTPTSPPSLYREVVPGFNQPFPPIPKLLRSSLGINISPSYYSFARHVDFPRKSRITVHNSRSSFPGVQAAPTVHDTSHAFFLPPNNPKYVAPSNTLPPLIILTHGGPTDHSGPGLSLQVQYFTSRGFAVALCNPIGSSGYGRSYREALNSHWGVADAADVASCAEHITKALQWADASRVGTVGGSAGGYVTLQVLYNHPELWRGAVSLYGISDVQRLVAGTHKFESWYANRLLFGAADPRPPKETMDRVYRERSARYHVDKIRAPLLLLQGDADDIVPLDQAQEMERAMRKGGKQVRLVVFEKEGHGFVRADTERRAVREQQAWWVMNLVRGGEEALEVEDRWVWVDESSGDEKNKSVA